MRWLDFLGYGGDKRAPRHLGRVVRHVRPAWAELSYQEKRSDGSPSSFFRLENSNREDA